MNTLHVFGDSFAEDFRSAWARKVSILQNLKLNNKGKGGTSIEWSALNLQETKLVPGDVVLFVLSSTRRFEIEPFVTENPIGACQAKDVKFLNDPNLEWYVRSRSDKVLDLKATLYTSWIYSLSQKNPEVKFIVISGFEDSQGSSVISKTQNYMMLDKFSLTQLSHYEVNELKLNPYMLYNLCGFDPRVNHLTTVNIDKLAYCISEVIDTWDSSNYTMNQFSKNVINDHASSYDDLVELYVKPGILDEEWIKATMAPPARIQGSKFHMLKEWLLERNII